MEKVKRRGKYVELQDGRLGMVYSDEPISGNRVLIHLLDASLFPSLNPDGKKLVTLKFWSELKVIGFFD